MNMQGALRARLLGQTAAGQRVTWVERPQNAEGGFPAITLQTLSGDHPQTHQGFQNFMSARVQLDIWSLEYTQARSILASAITVLAPRERSNGILFDRMFFEGDRDLAERLGTQTIYRVTIDLIVQYSIAP